jgi:hypothetical protein
MNIYTDKKTIVYTTEQVASKVNKSNVAVTVWAQHHLPAEQKIAGIWLFTDKDVDAIRALRRGPKRKSTKQQKQPSTQPEPTA